MTALFLLALALAMDAFAVSIARGAAGPHSLARAAETGLAFGAAQGVMPLLGWAAGALFIRWIEAFDHWIAFGLLAFLGARMLREAFSDSDDDAEEAASTERQRGHWAALLLAAIATSIDAAAAGLTLDLFGVPVLLACAIIAAVTAALCVPAYWFASRIGGKLGHVAEGLGGVVLIGLGVKILVEHLA
ncbi:manganese efflux pump MntP [Alteraurantiacibacter buctensis]|uniref:Putative manganese efflux pump MntP n=1 Tax=Alteraurantiacibacter buctensis TaxID=1503981 RepID=A0A844Z262_9SPHN|nr:manganese efflux pump MntP family protein [Alteraurantiacibacter buctensis]MXO73438.1 manganese efflux pump MntP [Alteraurantiacibacter buctensis]